MRGEKRRGVSKRQAEDDPWAETLDAEIKKSAIDAKTDERLPRVPARISTSPRSLHQAFLPEKKKYNPSKLQNG
jgi:hypothetical protein